MSKKSASPAASGQPTHLILFREPSEKNVSILSTTLKVGQASGTRARASCVILNEKNGITPKVFENLGVASASLSAADVKKLMAKPEIEDVVVNELRFIPPDVQGDAADAESGLNSNAPAQDPFVAYLQGLRDAIDLALKFKTGGVPDLAGLGKLGAGTSSAAQLAWHLSMVGVTAASSLTGTGVKIAVLDTGLDLNHPDFQGRVVAGESAVSFIAGESVQDGNGHGTHCAGLAAGTKSPRGGRRYGVAPDASLLIGKVMSDAGSGYDNQILDGMDWAAEMGAKVISMSLGSSRGTGRPFAVAYERLASVLLRRGIIVVAASGNASNRPAVIRPVENPAACPSILAVAAIDRNRQIAPFSCGQLDPIGEVNISAPGVSVYSTWMGGGYHSISGTSMATPIAAGIAALYWQKHPSATGKQIWEMVTSSAVSLGMPNDFGAGLVQAPR